MYFCHWNTVICHEKRIYGYMVFPEDESHNYSGDPQYPDNVFVCGDAANGASLVVRALASGRATAEKVNAFLSK